MIIAIKLQEYTVLKSGSLNLTISTLAKASEIEIKLVQIEIKKTVLDILKGIDIAHEEA